MTRPNNQGIFVFTNQKFSNSIILDKDFSVKRKDAETQRLILNTEFIEKRKMRTTLHQLYILYTIPKNSAKSQKM